MCGVCVCCLSACMCLCVQVFAFYFQCFLHFILDIFHHSTYINPVYLCDRCKWFCLLDFFVDIILLC